MLRDMADLNEMLEECIEAGAIVCVKEKGEVIYVAVENIANHLGKRIMTLEEVKQHHRKMYNREKSILN